MGHIRTITPLTKEEPDKFQSHVSFLLRKKVTVQPPLEPFNTYHGPFGGVVSGVGTLGNKIDPKLNIYFYQKAILCTLTS